MKTLTKIFFVLFIIGIVTILFGASGTLFTGKFVGGGFTPDFVGNAGGVSNAIDLIPGDPSVLIVTGANKRSFTITATATNAATNVFRSAVGTNNTITIVTNGFLYTFDTSTNVPILTNYTLALGGDLKGNGNLLIWTSGDAEYIKLAAQSGGLVTTGDFSAAALYGDGSGIYNINPADIRSGSITGYMGGTFTGSISGTLVGTGAGITNLNGTNVQGSVAHSLESISATNAPDGYQVASTNWVNQQLSQLGLHLYSSGITNDLDLASRTNIYQAFNDPLTDVVTNTITTLITNAYCYNLVSTQIFTRVESGPMAVNLYLFRSGGGGTITLLPEFYLYDTVSNTLTEVSGGPAQTISATTPTLYEWSISSPSYMLTNDNYFVVALKVGNPGTATPSLNLVSGGIYDSHVTLVSTAQGITAGVSSAEVLAIVGTNNLTHTGSNYFSNLNGPGTKLTALNPTNINSGTAGISITGNAATATAATTATTAANSIAWGGVSITNSAASNKWVRLTSATTAEYANAPAGGDVTQGGQNNFTGSNSMSGSLAFVGVDNLYLGNQMEVQGEDGSTILQPLQRRLLDTNSIVSVDWDLRRLYGYAGLPVLTWSNDVFEVLTAFYADTAQANSFQFIGQTNKLIAAQGDGVFGPVTIGSGITFDGTNLSATASGETGMKTNTFTTFSDGGSITGTVYVTATTTISSATVTNSLIATNVQTAGFTNNGTGRNVGNFTVTGDLAVNGSLNLASLNATNAYIENGYITNLLGDINLETANVTNLIVTGLTNTPFVGVNGSGLLSASYDGASLSNTVDIIAGSNVTVTTNASKRSFTIASTGGSGETGMLTNQWTTNVVGAPIVGGVGLSALTNRLDNIGTTLTPTLFLTNGTLAADGAQQASPMLTFEGHGWKTAATAASQPVKMGWYMLPVQGSANPYGVMYLTYSVNDSAWASTGTYMNSVGQLSVGNSIAAGGQITTLASAAMGASGRWQLQSPSSGRTYLSDNNTTPYFQLLGIGGYYGTSATLEWNSTNWPALRVVSSTNSQAGSVLGFMTGSNNVTGTFGGGARTADILSGGHEIATNSAPPAAAWTPGGMYFWNSNGTGLYLIKSGLGSTTWTSTNIISAP